MFWARRSGDDRALEPQPQRSRNGTTNIPRPSSVWRRLHSMRRWPQNPWNRRLSHQVCPITKWKHHVLPGPAIARHSLTLCLLFLRHSAAACSIFCGFLSNATGKPQGKTPPRGKEIGSAPGESPQERNSTHALRTSYMAATTFTRPSPTSLAMIELSASILSMVRERCRR